MGNQMCKCDAIDQLCLQIEHDSSLPLSSTTNNGDN